MNIEAIRAIIPGVKHLKHFDNAGASLPTQITLDAVINYLKAESITGGYKMMSLYQEQINTLYQRAGQLINADAEEIAITSNASEAFNHILYAIPFKKGDIILTSEIEYGNSFVNYIHLKNRLGVEIQMIPHLPNGDFDLAALQNAISEKVKLISIAHVPTSSGAVMPVQAIGAIARAHNILYLVDACQSIGQMPFDVKATGCDFASATSRKYLRGPRGLGFLYINKNVLDQLTPSSLDTVTADWQIGGTVALEKSSRMFEHWEKSTALMMGLSEAIRYLLELGVEHTWARIQELAAYTRQGLATISGVKVQDPGSQQCGIITFTKEGISPAKIKETLQVKNINTAVSLPGNSLTDMHNRGLKAAVRASVHYYNTKEEIDILLAELDQLR